MHNVYFLGPANSYSHILAYSVFQSTTYNLIPKKSFKEVLVCAKKEGIGILPIENSITSDVHGNIDALFENDLLIIGEGFLKISLNLIGNMRATLADITDVYSHIKALEQCSQYITAHNLNVHEMKSTSEGKKFVENSTHNALIGSRRLGKDKTLQILDSNIGNSLENMTRFVFVTKDRSILLSKNPNKASLIFTLDHTPGALAHVLTHIAKKNINVTKIQSRPIPGTEWEYSFWIDIQADTISTKEIHDLFSTVTNTYTIVGIYEKGTMYES